MFCSTITPQTDFRNIGLGIAFYVEFWYYYRCCDSFQLEGGGSMENVIAFFISVAASVVSYYLCKWLDEDDT